MIKTGDKLVCISGNRFYDKGQEYLVGQFINHKYFELFTGDSNECWYATVDRHSIYVSFNSTTAECNDATFATINHENSDWLNMYRSTCSA